MKCTHRGVAGRLAIGAALGLAFLLPTGPVQAAPACTTPAGAAPCNPHLADSVWAASHGNSYASGSSPFPAPAPGADLVRDRVTFPLVLTGSPISITFSAKYPDGGRVAWLSTVVQSAILKVDVDSGALLGRVLSIPTLDNIGISGAYNLLDRDGHFFVGRSDIIEVYGDKVAGQRTSPIARLAALPLPEEAMCGNDRLVGMTMTYDGHIAFATERGVVGVVPRRLDRFDADHLSVINLNEGHCDEPDDDLQIVSNSISADESGGIYVVSSQRMNRVQWTGKKLRVAWQARYNVGPEPSGVRLGAGSGSTPDVMGTAKDRDRFVVITDGGPLMNLVLLWRDDIPAGWKPVAKGKDRRIACEIPVRFGDPDATRTISEQSVLTSGYTSIIVNNAIKNENLLNLVPAKVRPAVAAELGGIPTVAPYGVERIDWDPRTRTCRTRWVNRTVSIPNAIPTLSTKSGVIYGQGQRNGLWGLEGVSLKSGRSVLWKSSTFLPASNSFYAATEVGPNGTIWQGTSGGIDVYRPADD